MKNLIYLFTLSCFLLFSCGSKTKQGEFLEIPVDIDQDFSLPLSEITEKIVAIDLELTDESLINPDRIRRILLCEDYVIVVGDEIFVFNKDGKFVHSIGSRGQGPGEYIGINSVALDEKNKRLFVSSGRKIICYDLDGNFIRESSITQLSDGSRAVDINHVNDELLLVVDQGHLRDGGLFNHPAMYRMNNDFQITDSCTIRKVYLEHFGTSINTFYQDFVLCNNSTIYLSYPTGMFFDSTAEVALRDTLYRFENNQLVPELRLKFKNDGLDGGGNTFINPLNIYRSFRYVFSRYYNSQKGHNHFLFCYDIKTGKGYNMQDGYTDDINQIEKRVNIRPLNPDTEMFYYLHTNMDPDDWEEPNPTLYIGKLKK
jgi:hypothetical protein